jgi:hypothetical protein
MGHHVIEMCPLVVIEEHGEVFHEYKCRVSLSMLYVLHDSQV